MRRLPFENAQELARQYPDTFWAPSAADLALIAPGVYVKVAAGCERFWVEVTNIEGDCITGVVRNDLVNTRRHGYRWNDVVTFHSDNVYNFDLSPIST